jgi:hypothetical protein
MAKPILSAEQLPTWTFWITAYAKAIGYSARHVRRVMMNEPRRKTVKKCGWYVTDHNRVLRLAAAGFDLTNAIEVGADTVALRQEIHELMDSVPDDLLDRP